MSDGRVSLERASGVAIITFERPHRRNALGGDMRQELARHLETLHRDASVGAVVLRGAEAAFCAGADVTDLATLSHQADGAQQLAARLDLMTETVLRLATELEQPTLAAVRGPAAGAGLGLALACDYVVAADDATLTTGFSRLGLAADWGTSFTLPARVGRERALDLLLRSPRIDAAQALALGLVDEMVEVDGHEARWRALAREWAEVPRPVRSAALGVCRPARDALAAALAKEREHQLACFTSPEARERLDAFVARAERKRG
ncbi:MAG: enoyl-CoA hydratase/isomerase family protein [Sorangiineae bacterium]|nr:enoyl-CoA hydratase/isomerase family protein [Polyangiaceae bacterium]MEB2323392.1 enoyl-CoA hydratase/isomerase family protein [Sorangiineae bacterium]